MTSASLVNVTFKAKYFVFGGGKSHDQLTAAREDVLPLNISLESPDDLKVIIAESTEFKAVTAAGGVRKPVHDIEDTIEPLLPSVVGFYMPGHQFKGKKHVLNTAADMTTMYALHPQKRTNPRIRTIYIFAEVRPAKEGVAAQCRRHGTGQTSSAAATLMADKVEVYEHLKEKHRDRGFSDEQIHMWAYLVATKRHDSQEHPPREAILWKVCIHQEQTSPRGQ